ncbi:MAG: DUF1080 domain-containing protein [Candidatus Hydrogenedens sp.]|nr:DUF1080 domain-containing protein [Candidatus Hydrogenedens sp.]
MMKVRYLIALAAIGLFLTGIPAAYGQFDSPVIKEWVVTEVNDQGEEEEVDYMTLDGVLVHESDPELAPQPPIVTPGSIPGMPPSDAIVLFNGKNTDGWSAEDGSTSQWIVKNAVLQPVEDSGTIRTVKEFGSCQLHVEWATPANVEGDGQGRGNSGVFLMGQYEVQILDSYENTTYPDGQAGALYGRSAPLVNASRKPGEWQSFDIIFHRPVFDENGEVVKRATFTIFHNGVLIQDHLELSGGTLWKSKHSVFPYEAHGDRGPVVLQDHGNPVSFRNIWIRELED